MNTDDIWEELDKMFKLPERLIGDIDSTQMAERYKVNQTTARRLMRKLANGGEYQEIEVRDVNSVTGKRIIIRKIK